MVCQAQTINRINHYAVPLALSTAISPHVLRLVRPHLFNHGADLRVVPDATGPVIYHTQIYAVSPPSVCGNYPTTSCAGVMSEKTGKIVKEGFSIIACGGISGFVRAVTRQFAQTVAKWTSKTIFSHAPWLAWRRF